MIRILIATAALALPLVGCSSCPACINPPALQVTVVDGETGAALTDATVTATSEGKNRLTLLDRTSNSCGDGCYSLDGAADTYAVSVTAPGYTTSSFSLEVDNDSCGMHDSIVRKVSLHKLSASKPAEVTELPTIAGCH